MSEQEMTRSECPICGRSFPHKAGYKPVTCSKAECLKEAVRLGLFDDQQYTLGLLMLCARKRDEAEAEWLKTLKEDGNIADNMRSHWANQANESAR